MLAPGHDDDLPRRVLRMPARLALDDDGAHHAAEEITRRVNLASARKRLPRSIGHNLKRYH